MKGGLQNGKHYPANTRNTPLTVILNYSVSLSVIPTRKYVIGCLVSCNILRNFISENVFRLTCFSLAQTSDSRTLALSAVFAAAVILISLAATHLVFRKAEIK
jgi:hypothetical protein